MERPAQTVTARNTSITTEDRSSLRSTASVPSAVTPSGRFGEPDETVGDAHALPGAEHDDEERQQQLQGQGRAELLGVGSVPCSALRSVIMEAPVRVRTPSRPICTGL